jgi:arginine transport system substrate-binding protein
MKQILKLTSLLLFTIAFLFTNVIHAEPSKIIKFATEATYPPFESMDASGEIKGFDIDVAKALCAEIKAQCTFTSQPWDSLIPSLKLGKFDAIIAAVGITNARKQQVDFTIPYFASTGSFVGLQNQKFSLTPEGLNGKTIGVQGGTVYETYLKNYSQKNIKIKAYASMQDAFLDLNSGRIDALFGDTPTVIDWLKNRNTNHQYALIGEPINDPQTFGAGYGIALRKGNTELLDILNKAITTIKNNGSYEKIARAHFDKPAK